MGLKGYVGPALLLSAMYFFALGCLVYALWRHLGMH